MTEILTIIFAFIVFMIVMGRGYLAAIRPASLVIMILISLAVGAVLASIVVWVFEAVIKFIVPIIIIVAILVCISIFKN